LIALKLRRSDTPAARIILIRHDCRMAIPGVAIPTHGFRLGAASRCDRPSQATAPPTRFGRPRARTAIAELRRSIRPNTTKARRPNRKSFDFPDAVAGGW
jgi:hypothetical protein